MTRNVLEETARAVAEHRRVDWEALLAAHPELTGPLGNLRTLEMLADVLGGLGPDTLAPGTTWGTLEIREKVGEGSFGEVYRAWDPALCREVALKLQRRAGSSPDAYVAEARRLARVRHPNVLIIHGVEVHDDRAGLWTDFLPGDTLEDEVREGRRFEEEELLRAGVTLARALHAVHEAGLVHGDVKAANVMRDAAGRLVLMDFGAGRAHADGVADGPTTVGTPLVMAPELLRGGPPTVATDVYALGVLLRRLATGRHPRTARTQAELLDRLQRDGIPPVAELRPDLTPELAVLLDRTLAMDPAGRPGSSLVLAEWLAAVSDADAASDPDGSDPDALAGVKHDLPIPPGRLVGRRAELASIRQAILASRVVTLVGPGGSGKTRLALEVARRVASGYEEIRWIDLTVAHGEADVAAALVRAFDLRASRGAARSAAALAIGGRPVLLVFDNAERVRAELSGVVRTLVEACPRLCVLVTSRESMRVEGEHAQSIDPLPVPRHDDVTLSEALDSDAVRLFALRGARARESFVVTDANRVQVARVCRRLDGIPLALELAAARLDTLDPDELATRIERRLDVVADRKGTRRPTHRTLDALLGWSVDLVSDGAARLLERLAVFEGSVRLAAIERVCADEILGDTPDAAHPLSSPDEARIDGEPVLDLLTALVDASLVGFEPGSGGGVARYRLLETTRTYARTRLERSAAGGDPVGRRLLHWSRDVVVHGEERFGGEGSAEYLDDIGAERATIGSVLRSSPLREVDDLRAFHRISSRMVRWGRVRGFPREGLRFVTRAAALPEVPELAEEKGDALNGLALLHADLGDHEAAIGFHERAITYAKEHGVEVVGIRARMNLGMTLQEMGRLDEARDCYLGMRPVFLANRDLRGLAFSATMLGVIEERADRREESERWFEEALARQEEMPPDPFGMAIALTNLAGLRNRCGRSAEAVELSSRAVPLLREIGDTVRLAGGLVTYAAGLVDAGRVDDSRAALLEATGLHGSIDNPYGLLHLASMWCGYFRAVDDLSAAAAVLAFCDGLEADGSARLADVDREELHASMAEVREGLDARGWSEGVARGREMTRDTFLAFVRDRATQGSGSTDEPPDGAIAGSVP